MNRRHTTLGSAVVLLGLLDIALVILLVVLLTGSTKPLTAFAIVAAVVCLALSGPLMMISLQEDHGIGSQLRRIGRNKPARNGILGVTAVLGVLFIGALLTGFPVDSPKLAAMRAAIFERPPATPAPAAAAFAPTSVVTDAPIAPASQETSAAAGQEPAAPTLPAVAGLSMSSTRALIATATPQATPTPSPTLTPVVIPSATPTETVAPTPTAPPPTATETNEPTATSTPRATATVTPTETPHASATPATVIPTPTVSDEQAQELVREAVNAANDALIDWLLDTTQATDPLKPFFCGDPAWKSVTSFIATMSARPGDAITAKYSSTGITTASQDNDSRWQLQQTETWTYTGQGWELKSQAETYAYWVIENPDATQRFCIDQYNLVKP